MEKRLYHAINIAFNCHWIEAIFVSDGFSFYFINNFSHLCASKQGLLWIMKGLYLAFLLQTTTFTACHHVYGWEAHRNTGTGYNWTPQKKEKKHVTFWHFSYNWKCASIWCSPPGWYSMEVWGPNVITPGGFVFRNQCGPY